MNDQMSCATKWSASSPQAQQQYSSTRGSKHYVSSQRRTRSRHRSHARAKLIGEYVVVEDIKSKLRQALFVCGDRQEGRVIVNAERARGCNAAATRQSGGTWAQALPGGAYKSRAGPPEPPRAGCCG
ncbi:jg17735 [Pararge aegeria aegeria]|uniref:Jg17735 protein n=1 Tax=Pararge aegeria aegeria TaxID=348720 RepID=A0A8S4S7V4_9NEOP|nr:jg17735 [Pararge aegeria aegeria]